MPIVDNYRAIREARDQLRGPGIAPCPRQGDPCPKSCGKRKECEALYAAYGLFRWRVSGRPPDEAPGE